MSRPSSLPGSGCSTLGTTARPSLRRTGPRLVRRDRTRPEALRTHAGDVRLCPAQPPSPQPEGQVDPSPLDAPPVGAPEAHQRREGMPPHCDSLDGPVVTAARQALEADDIDLILPFVPEDGEA